MTSREARERGGEIVSGTKYSVTWVAAPVVWEVLIEVLDFNQEAIFSWVTATQYLKAAMTWGGRIQWKDLLIFLLFWRPWLCIQTVQPTQNQSSVVEERHRGEGLCS